MTSMEQEFSRKVSMNQVREAVKRHIETVFGVELVMISLSELQGLLCSSIPHLLTSHSNATS
jgi:lipoate-protein ligase A